MFRRLLRTKRISRKLFHTGTAALAVAWYLTPGQIRGAETTVSLQSLLQALSRSGVQLIYSSETVTPDLRTTPPPTNLPLSERLRTILSPFQLEAKLLPTGGYAITRITGALEINVNFDRNGAMTPAAGVDLTADELPQHYRTDEHGHVRIADLPAKHYEIRIERDGEVLAQRSVSVRAHATRHVELRVISVPESLTEITVESKRSSAGITVQKEVARDDLQSTPTTSSDALREVQLQPGAATAGYTARTHLRGSRDDETLFRYDGLTLTDPYHLESVDSMFSAVDPSITQSVTSWTGIAPIQYGTQVGAVIDIAPRTITQPTADARFSNQGAGILGGTTFDDSRGSIMVAGRVRNARSPTVWLESASYAPVYDDAVARVTFDLTAHTQLIGGAFVVVDRPYTIAGELLPENQQARLSSKQTYAWLRLIQDWSPAVHTETLLSTERSDENVSGQVDAPGIETGFLENREGHTGYTAREELTWSSGPSWSGLIGAERTQARLHEAQVSAVTFGSLFVPALQPVATQTINADSGLQGAATALYGDIQWRPAERTVADLGLRYDNRSYRGGFPADNHSTVRLDLQQQLSAATTLRLGWGQSSQAGVYDTYQRADGTLIPEPVRRVTQSNLGLEQHVDGAWFLRAQGYTKRESTPFQSYEDVFSPFNLLPDIDVGTQLVQSQSARMRGVELRLERRQSGPWSGWVSYTRSSAVDDIAGRWVPRSWDQPDAAQIGTRWQQGPWSLSALLNWHTGWPYTPLQVSPPIWQPQNPPVIALGTRNSARFQDFFSLDLRSAWEHELAGGVFQVSLELDDATNAKTVCCRTYSIEQLPNGSSRLEDTPGYWLAFAPVLMFSWRH